MILFYFSVGLSVLYVLVQAQNIENNQYDTLVSLNNHTNFLNDVFVKGLKINFNDYLIQDPFFKNVIDYENVLKDSDISFLCDKNIPNLNNSVALNYTKKYPGILLCMGLSHILLLNGILLTQQQGPGKISMALPKTRSELDSLVSTMNSNNTLKENVMCKQHKVTLPTYNSDVEEYIKLLNPLLENEDTCETMCLIGDTINPICAFIIQANSVFYQNLKESHVNATAQVENVDSAKALEQNSINEMTLPNTKEITDDFKETLPVNKGNVAAELNKDRVTVLSNDTNNDTLAEPAVPNEQNMTSTTPSISKVAVDAAEDLINDDSGENTDNAEEYNAETVKQPSPSLAPVVTQTKTRPATNGTLPTQPNSKPVLLEEDNAKEAVEGDLPTNSEIKEVPEQKTKQIKPAEETKKTSGPKNMSSSTKMSEKTVDADKNELELGDLEDNLPPPLQDPPAPNEGDNILFNANNDDDTFSSNVDQKQQMADPGDAVLDIQENTPYIIAKDGFVEAEDSHFFMYFVLMFVICIVLYVGFYNKRKLLALALEGRAGRRTRSRRGTYSRVNTSFDESKDHLLY